MEPRYERPRSNTNDDPILISRFVAHVAGHDVYRYTHKAGLNMLLLVHGNGRDRSFAWEMGDHCHHLRSEQREMIVAALALLGEVRDETI